MEFNVLACVNAVTAREPLAVYRFLRDEVGARFLQFIPIVERQDPGGYPQGDLVSQALGDRQAYGRFLNAIFRRMGAARRGPGLRADFRRRPGGLDRGTAPDCAFFEETCGQALAPGHNGECTPATITSTQLPPREYAGKPPGGFWSVSEAQQKFGQDKHDGLRVHAANARCVSCATGGCPKDRILRTPPVLLYPRALRVPVGAQGGIVYPPGRSPG